MENSYNTSKVVGALLVGTLAAAAIGILFAPHKGRKTRHNIANDAKDLAINAKNLANDVKHKVRDDYDELVHNAEKASKYANGQSSNISDHMKQRMSF